MQIVEETPYRFRIEREGRMRVPGVRIFRQPLDPEAYPLPRDLLVEVCALDVQRVGAGGSSSKGSGQDRDAKQAGGLGAMLLMRLSPHGKDPA